MRYAMMSSVASHKSSAVTEVAFITTSVTAER